MVRRNNMKLEDNLGLNSRLLGVVSMNSWIAVIKLQVTRNIWTEAHYHRTCSELYWIEKGSAIIICKNGKKVRKYELRDNSEILIKPEVEHAMYITEGTEISIFRIRSENGISVKSDIETAYMLEKALKKYH